MDYEALSIETAWAWDLFDVRQDLLAASGEA